MNKHKTIIVGAILAGILFLSVFAYGVRGESVSEVTSSNLHNSSKIHPMLLKQMQEAQEDAFIPVLVELKDQGIYSRLGVPEGTRVEVRTSIIEVLKEEAVRRNERLVELIQSTRWTDSAREVKAYWVSPVIYMEATPALINFISEQEDVAQVRNDQKYTLEPLTDIERTADLSNGSDLLWNLDMLNVELAEAVFGVTGQGVVVAGVDSGVDWGHPGLMKKYRGYRENGLSVHAGNWYVPTGEPYIYPGDGFGHGTHTMGTIVGGEDEENRTGVAIGATWIAVKLFNNAGETQESWIHDSYQWLLAPNGDPALAPDIVNNSWGSMFSANEVFRPAVTAMRAAGIFEVYSAGNTGPGAETIHNPGSLPEAFAVGAIDKEGIITDFSARGPSPWHEVKPEVSAPGVQILSTFPGGGYAQMGGTSMAAPHVAGVAALLLEADPDLTPIELENILKTTAAATEEGLPNNNYGWGLVDAYHAVMAAKSVGEVTGVVYGEGGELIPFPEISLLPRGGAGYTIRGEKYGNYIAGVMPGLYEISAVGFGYNQKTIGSVLVEEGDQIRLDFYLDKKPTQTVSGGLSAADTGAGITATVEVKSNGQTIFEQLWAFAYSHDLPSGVYEFAVKSPGFRTLREVVTVPLGAEINVDFALEEGPRVLLVDSGAYYYGGYPSYYRDALETLNYYYDEITIRTPFGGNGKQSDVPTIDDLEQYDVVIWSSPLDSPGLIGATETISSYLGMGGKLLVTGQDIAYWDAGGNILSIYNYIFNQMGIDFLGEGHKSNLAGVPSEPLSGINLVINPADSALNQAHPDHVNIHNPLVADSVLEWGDGAIGGIFAGGCYPYRAAWLGFGLEGAGPRDARIETLERVFNWFDQPPPANGLVLSNLKEVYIQAPGRIISESLMVINTGVNTDTFVIGISEGGWPIELYEVEGMTPILGSVEVPGCSEKKIVLNKTIPISTGRNKAESHPIIFSSVTSPVISQVITLTAKTPAPVLIVDDSRWQYYGDDFAAVLAELEVPYDKIVTFGRFKDVNFPIAAYDAIIWTTGLDWFSPIDNFEAELLMAYLENGGGVILGSQDLLDVKSKHVFVTDYLGIEDVNLTVTPTLAASIDRLTGLSNHSLPLNFPLGFDNWGDGFETSNDTSPIYVDQQFNTIGASRELTNGRSVFFSFALEGLDHESKKMLLGDALLRAGPFHGTSIDIPAVSYSDSYLQLSVKIKHEDAEIVTATVRLPEGTTAESFSSAWNYDAVGDRLTWTGDPGVLAGKEMTASIGINVREMGGNVLDFGIYLEDNFGYSQLVEQNAILNAPWYQVNYRVPESITAGEVASYHFTVENISQFAGNVYVTMTLPLDGVIITDSIEVSEGIAFQEGILIRWAGVIEPDEVIYIKCLWISNQDSIWVSTFIGGVELRSEYQWELQRFTTAQRHWLRMPIIYK